MSNLGSVVKSNPSPIIFLLKTETLMITQKWVKFKLFVSPGSAETRVSCGEKWNYWYKPKCLHCSWLHNSKLFYSVYLTNELFANMCCSICNNAGNATMNNRFSIRQSQWHLDMRGCRRVGGTLSLTASYSHRPLNTANITHSQLMLVCMG